MPEKYHLWSDAPFDLAAAIQTLPDATQDVYSARMVNSVIIAMCHRFSYLNSGIYSLNTAFASEEMEDLIYTVWDDCQALVSRLRSVQRYHE